MAQINTKENIKTELCERMIIEIFRRLKQNLQTELLQEMKKMNIRAQKVQKIFYKVLNSKEQKIIKYYCESDEFEKDCIYQRITSVIIYQAIKKNFITKGKKNIELYTLINKETRLLNCFNSSNLTYQKEMLEKKNFITKSKENFEIYTLINEEIELLNCFNSLNRTYQKEILDHLGKNLCDTNIKCTI